MQLQNCFLETIQEKLIMKISAAKLGSAFAALALFFSAQNSFAQNFYKWVDAKGSTHYTATPPPNTAKKKGKVATYGWKNSSAAPAAAAENNASPAAENTAKETEKAAPEPAVQENKSAHPSQTPAAR